MWLIELVFPQFCKSDMSKYGCLEVFHRVPWNSKKNESRLYFEGQNSRMSKVRFWSNVTNYLFTYFWVTGNISEIVKSCKMIIQRIEYDLFARAPLHLSRGTASPKFVHVRQAKTQINLNTVWSESSQGILWVAKEPMRLQRHSEDSDQTARMRRLIWVFARCTYNLVGNAVPLFICDFCRYIYLDVCMCEWQI